MKANKNTLATPPNASFAKQALLGMYGVIGVTIATIGVIKVPFAEGYAKDYWRQALAGIVLLLALIAGIISLAIYTFNANNFKSQIVDYVKTNKQRDLILEGDLKVTFFPNLGLDSNKITLSQRNSSKVFASIDQARFNIAWWPLLFKQLQIESVTLDRLHANIIRSKNGSTNFDDLLVTDGSLSDVKFAIDSIHLQNSSANFQDEASDLFLTLHDMNIETDRIADLIPGKVSANFRLGSSKPRIETWVKLSTHLVFDLKGKHYELANFEGAVEGEAAGINKLVLNFQGNLNSFAATEKQAREKIVLDRFSVSVKGELEDRNLDAKFNLAKFQSGRIQNDFNQSDTDQNQPSQNKLGRHQATATGLMFMGALLRGDESLATTLELPVVGINEQGVRADVFSGTFDLLKQGRGLQGKLSSPLSYDFESRQLQLPALISHFNISHALLASKLNAVATGNFLANLSAQPTEQSAKLTFNSKIEDSNFTGDLQLRDFSKPAYSFNLATSALDLDKYLIADWSKRFQDDAAPVDFSSIKTLNLRGKFRSNEFKFAKIKANKLLAEIKVDQSNLVVEPFSARLYGGTLQGGFNIAAGGDADANLSISGVPKIALQQKLIGVQFDALLGDLTSGGAKLAGRGNLALDLSAAGMNMGELRKNINGDVSFAIMRGSLAGINLAEALVAGKNQLGITTDEAVKLKNTVAAKFTESTNFSEFKATIAVLKSIAHSSDFLLKSPLFTSKGEGDINLGAGQFNFKFNTTVAPNLRRSKNGELAELSGILVPMQVSGTIAAPTILFDFGAATGGNMVKLIKLNKVMLATPLAVSAKPLVAEAKPAKK